MNFESSDYLPNTEKRIAHLREIIAGRPVAILAAGPSIKELEERIDELRNTDICYFGINTFFVQENHILKKISKYFSVIIEATLIKDDEDILPNIFDKVVSFLDRKDNNILVSSLTSLLQFSDKYDEKLLSPSFVNGDRKIPNRDHPLHLINGNSLSGLIYLAVIGGASKVILFGADGYTVNTDTEKTYYRADEYYPTMEKSSEPQQQLMRNTNKGFNPIIPISLRNIYQTHDIKPIPILNCSEVSFLTPFPKVSYNDAFAILLGKKGIEDIKDLRVPTASIIIPHSGNENRLQTTLTSIAQQSYSNYETVVVDESQGFVKMMKKAISSARGKYIFYCPSGNTYNDLDWINSCLEVLENRPQISLVCGLPKNAESPWPKKKFIYYWLKKKIFFPANLICVRKEILEQCLLRTNNAYTSTELNNWLVFNLRFNMAGYLPDFIPVTSNRNEDMRIDQGSLDVYKRQINNYKSQLIFKRISHRFRDGTGNILSGKFYLSIFLFYGLVEKISDKLPDFLRPILNTAKQAIRRSYIK
ncbi:MAG: glycosyltransferase family 2 protein [Candidatus Yanofskybacteria bacterium]|nr:glycosyltransferase family 2 protein [Candidatus Yanofskybacteria bacterium]